jgi:hypothetical protein
MGEDWKKDAPRASSVGKFCYYRRVELSRVDLSPVQLIGDMATK